MSRVSKVFRTRVFSTGLIEQTCLSPAGQRRQVPSDPDWEQDPQAGPLLQDQEGPGTQLEVVRSLQVLPYSCSSPVLL